MLRYSIFRNQIALANLSSQFRRCFSQRKQNATNQSPYTLNAHSINKFVKSKANMTLWSFFCILIGGIAGLRYQDQIRYYFRKLFAIEEQIQQIKTKRLPQLKGDLEEYGNQTFDLISYYDKNNSTHRAIEHIYQQKLLNSRLTIVYGQSGIGKTTSLQEFIKEKRLDKTKNDKIFYISMKQNPNAYEKIINLLDAIQVQSKQNRQTKYTIFIDDINIIKNSAPDQQILTQKICKFNEYISYARRNFRICLISRENKFTKQIQDIPYFRKYLPQFIEIKQKLKQQKKKCISNIMINFKKIILERQEQYNKQSNQQNSIPAILNQKQNQVVEYLIKQQHNLGQTFIWFQEYFHTNYNKNLDLLTFIKSRQQKIEQIVKQKIISLQKNNEENFKQFHFKLINKTLGSTSMLVKKQVLYNEQKKKFKCSDVMNIIKTQIMRISPEKSKKQVSTLEENYFQKLEIYGILIDCLPRSNFVREIFQKV